MSRTVSRTVLGLIIILIIIAGIVFVYGKYNPSVSVWFPRCPVKALTGWSCPGCGIQRATHALLHGRMAEALAYNYFFVLSIPYALAVSVAFVLDKLRVRTRFIALAEHRTLAIIYVCCFCVWFVARNVLGV